MRICVPIPCFFPKSDLCDAIHLVASLGFDAVEIYQQWRGKDPNDIKKALEESGVEMLSMCTSEFRLTDPTLSSLWLEGLRESCAAAKQIGVKRLITQVGPDTGRPREEQHNAIVQTLRAATPILEEYDVTVMIEPLNTYVDHKGYYLWSSAEAFRIIREVAHPLVKVIYDIYHQQVMEGNIIQSITQNLDCIAHLHAAGTPGRHELQFGENDYRYIMETVEKAGYTGAIGVEYRPLLDPIESLKSVKELYC